MSSDSEGELEWQTRRNRIDPLLNDAGWRSVAAGQPIPLAPHRIEEYETTNGPADYALTADGRVLGVVEAKKVTLGPQNVLTQAERYARGIHGNGFNYDGMHVPFLYSTNGEVIWFHDVRHLLSRSRKIARFHTPDALKEMLGTDFDAACQRLRQVPNNHPRLRPYQVEANTATEKAIADRKRHMLVAMATGTGKTFTMVNQAYRLMKAGVARRILFLVDRRALAAQAVRSAHRPPPSTRPTGTRSWPSSAKSSPPAVTPCREALDALGRVSHSWQDYYAHAVLWPSGEAAPAWSAIPPITGSPYDDNPSLMPSSYSIIVGGDHPRIAEPVEEGSEEQRLRLSAVGEFMDPMYISNLPYWHRVCSCVCPQM